MKKKPVGATGGATKLFRQCNPKDFSDDQYEGMTLYWSRSNQPVVVLLNKATTVPVWKVLCGTSAFYFREYGEVVDFCKQHGYRPLDGQTGQEHLPGKAAKV